MFFRRGGRKGTNLGAAGYVTMHAYIVCMMYRNVIPATVFVQFCGRQRRTVGAAASTPHGYIAWGKR